MRHLMMSAMMVAVTPAMAASNEINFDLGFVGNEDAAYGLFSESDTMFGLGVSGGVVLWDLNDVLGVHLVGGWNRTWQGATIHSATGSLQTGLWTDEFSLGPKISVTLWGWFTPYLTVQGSVMHGLVSLEDLGAAKDSPTSFTRGAVIGGFRSMAGVDFVIPHDRGPVAVGIYSEIGYGGYAPMSWEDFGSMQPGGFAFRSGVGLRF